jgi:small ligand-binding sensory domain FIST
MGRVVAVSFAAAMSEHPITAHAVGEVTGTLLEQLGERPDLVTVFVTPPHAGALEDTVRTIDDVLHPLVVLGCAAESVVGPHREVEHAAAIAVFAAHTGPVLPLALQASEDGLGALRVTGWPEAPSFSPSALVLVADPYSFPIESFLAWIDDHHPGLPVIGGMASAARGPGGNRLALGRVVSSTGAVGALLGPGIEVETVVSQGCRPFGRPLVVTRAESNVIFELAGRPALERLVTQAHDTLSEDEVAVVEHGGLQVGRVIDEHRDAFGPGDFLVRNVIGADRTSGAVAVGDTVAVGTTVQFHLRDSHSAHEDLRTMLSGRRADGALVFTCNGRGTRMFDQPHHDVSLLAQELGPLPLAGCFAAGELGTIGGRNFLHGFTASVALLRDPLRLGATTERHRG